MFLFKKSDKKNKKEQAPSAAAIEIATKRIKDTLDNNYPQLDLSHWKVVYGKNKLGSLPLDEATLQKLKENLKILKVNNHLLISLPSELSILSNLRHLSIAENKLTSIPSVIFELKQLNQLEIQGNELSAKSLPSDLTKLKKLKVLNVSGCGLTSLLPPGDLAKFVVLENLDFSNNPEISQFPEDILQLIRLKELHASNNSFTEIPAGIGKLICLTVLDMQNNKISCVPEPQLGALVTAKTLKTVRLSKNPLKGTIKDLVLIEEDLLKYLSSQAPSHATASA